MGDEQMARKHRKHRSILPPWSVPSLLLAAALLAVSKTGFGDELEHAVAALGSNPTFVRTALSAEMGTLDTTEPHIPAAVDKHAAKHTEKLPEYLLERENAHSHTGADTALVAESLFRPPKEVQSAEAEEEAPTTTADGYPVRELTITGQSGGYPGRDGVYIQNDSGLSYDLAEMLSEPLKITKNASADKPTVFILHTHASEAYVDQHGGRTEDTAHNVVHIGDVIQKALERRGIGVLHCREIIDEPSYNQSYNRAMEIIDGQMERHPSLKVILDVHRDSMITDSGMEYKVVSEVSGRKCAQLMMVMGTNAGGLTHPNWKSNLNFAVHLQKRILKEYPTLMRPVNLRAQRFNEQATTGSMILECGTSGNTLHEAELAVGVFAEKLADALEEE